MPASASRIVARESDATSLAFRAGGMARQRATWNASASGAVSSARPNESDQFIRGDYRRPG
jgi:hypothetical protein